MSYDEHLISMAGGDGDVLDQIQRRADKATGGVWKAWDRGIGYEVHGPDDEPLNFNFRETFTKSDAEFIAHARMDIPALLAMVREQRAVIERVKALHVPHEDSGKCNECTVSPYSMHSIKYPCPTIDALTTKDPS